MVIGDNNIVGPDNVIGGNYASGVYLAFYAQQNYVGANFIGTDSNGSQLGNGGWGISEFGSENSIGGTPDQGNTIGFNSSGIAMVTGSFGSYVSNNYVGTNASGDALPNTNHGIFIEGINHTIGGAPGETFSQILQSSNEVAHNGGAGVMVKNGAALDNSIRGNSIHSNSGEGIDLNDDGATANDLGDTDGGANFTINHPDIVFAHYDPTSGQFEVEFVLDVLPGVAASDFPIMIDIYESDGGGEGQHLLESTTFELSDVGSSKFASFVLSPGLDFTSSSVVATATTDPPSPDLGSTSEFSRTVPVPEPGSLAMLGAGSLLLTVLATRWPRRIDQP
jgi:hypothetical protein